MSNPTETFTANLAHHIRNREVLVMGGGTFEPDEIAPVLAILKAAAAPDPRDAVIAELVAALEIIHVDDDGDGYCDASGVAIINTALANAKALTPARPAVTIRVTVEGGVVQAIEADGSADVTAILLDFDTDGADMSDGDMRLIDGEACWAKLMQVDYVPAACLVLPDDMQRPALAEEWAVQRSEGDGSWPTLDVRESEAEAQAAMARLQSQEPGALLRVQRETYKREG